MSNGTGVIMASNIVVIGLGYVGLPLAVALARHFPVIGFDIDDVRINQLKTAVDRTGEIEPSVLRDTSLKFTFNTKDIHGQDIYIVTVPTPVTNDNLPDLSILQKASETVGKALSKNAIVIYESTVYPGVTEDFCGPILEKISGLKSGQEFFLGYSPERINPGDKEHTVDKITKVVSGQTPEVTERLKYIYGSINNGNVFVAKNIKTAEAAKVIENAQRDINIAFVNEIATIVGKMNLSIYDVLAAAETKWNFLKFKPGLVGGHCIGVDPYYLAECSRQLGHEPEVILAGRRTNESMGGFLASAINKEIKNLGITNAPAKILVLGLTFKEDIPDLRNTKVLDLVQSLKAAGHTVDVHDAIANSDEAWAHLKIRLLPSLENVGNYNCIVGAVPHRSYLDLSIKHFQQLLLPKGLIADIKNMWREIKFPDGLQYWSL